MTPLCRRGRILLALAALLPLTFLASSSPVAGQEGPPPPPAPPANMGTDSPFAGMVEVPAGKYKIGIDKKELEKLYEKHPNLNGKEAASWWELLLVETPEHTVDLPAYAIDRYEVTNAQYHLYLEKACRTSVFVTDEDHAIEDLAAKLYGPNPTAWEMESIYILNKAKLLEQKDVILPVNGEIVKAMIEEFNKDLPEPARVKDFTALPEPNMVRGWCRFRLPKDMALTAYTRVMPETWRPDGKPTEAQLSLPVQFISGEDAEAFAEWAGKHVPTEEEWETAARGPEGFLYPWGNAWDCEKEKNRILWKSAQAEPRGPAPITQDGPIAVNRLGESQSAFGCFHMLGNLTEWTSSIPTAYKDSESKWKLFGQRGLRVMRGCSYGDGADFRKMELLIRNTARIIHGYGNGIDRRDRWQTFGFRCAKYAMPAAENMAVTIARLVERRSCRPA